MGLVREGPFTGILGGFMFHEKWVGFVPRS